MSSSAQFSHQDDLSEQVLVALVGNPNTGKTTLFNRLTGAKQRVGNYAGVTVERKEGVLRLRSLDVNVLDLPGSYSLVASSEDALIMVDVLSGKMRSTPVPRVVVCVLDSTNLLRNLYLASQIADIGIPIVLALNMMDEAFEQGIFINHQKLSENLNVPVVPIVARRGQGLDDLKAEIEEAIRHPKTMDRVVWPEIIERESQRIEGLSTTTVHPLTRSQSIRLLFDPESTMSMNLAQNESHLYAALRESKQRVEEEQGLKIVQIEPLLRYQWLSMKLEGVINNDDSTLPFHSKKKHHAAHQLTDRIDKVLTHKVFGLGIFFLLMMLVFQSIYVFAEPLMAVIEQISGWLGEQAGPLLETTPMLQSLVVDGVLAGVGGVVVFLPQILLLFLFISLLEDSGYMARAAYMMDRVFGWCGLNGKSFVPLLSSYACAVPGIMATRTIEDRDSRLVTILTAPLMSCSARLPVYTLFIGAFIEPLWGAFWAGVTLFLLHVLGLFLAVPVAFFLKRFISMGRQPVPFIMEMPPYRMPQFNNIATRLSERAKVFIVQAGTVILCFSVLVWAMCYFPRSESVEAVVTERYILDVSERTKANIEEARQLMLEPDNAEELQKQIASAHMENSYMGRLGRFLQPIFEPAGFDWKVTVGILASFPARELIISTLGIIYRLGADVNEESGDLVDAMRSSVREDGTPVFTTAVALSVMVFFALCMQCGATISVMARESNWGWAWFGFAYMTIFAWCSAVLVYQIGSRILP